MEKALKIPSELKEESPYKQHFVEMVREAEVEYQSGEGKRINLEHICK